MYDEELAIRQIEQMPEAARNHLSHVIRNGITTLSAAAKLARIGRIHESEVEVETRRFEGRIRELGL